jgi:glutathione S-transferase
MAAPLSVFLDSRAPASQLVRWLLRERGVPWVAREIDTLVALEHLEPWYVRLTPAAAVPMLVRDGAVADRLSAILLAVHAAAGDDVMLPAACRDEVEGWLLRLDDFPVDALGRGADTIGALDLGRRRRALAKRAVAHPDLDGTYRALAASLEDGPGDRIATIEAILTSAEAALALPAGAAGDPLRDNDGPWLVGSSLTLADVALAACVAALARSELRYLLTPDRWPHLAKWWGRFRRQPSVRRSGLTDHPDGQPLVAWAGWLLPRVAALTAALVALYVVVRWWRRRSTPQHA